MATIVRMPEVLADTTEAAITTWLVALGQEIAVGTALAEIETDKAVVEYASEVEGTVLHLFADEGATVTVGDPIVAVGAPGEAVEGVEGVEGATGGATPASSPAATAPAPAASSAGASSAVPQSCSVTRGPAEPSGRRFTSPLVRRLAKEHGIDLATITGTGPSGRVVRRDIEGAVREGRDVPMSPAASGAEPAATASPAAASAPAAPAAPASGASAPDGVEEVPLTSMRRAIARRLTESKTSVPHFYLVADARVDELLALRKQVNAVADVKVSVNDFVLKAVAGVLRAIPEANATWGETVLHRHLTVDVAVAVAIEGGLVTPVVRNVDRLAVSEIALTVRDLAERARAGRLRQHELEGGSFSVSNLGMYGSQEFSAIINPPQAGILAVGAVRQVPVVDDGELAVGTVMTVTLSADHRVIDGALAAQWLTAFVERIENPMLLLV
ncbi:dihydrolipoamide acetyltransferase family protein [Streptomyces sp. NBC_01180]|uniref:dihydrolipoamide acetyltransferase family protein n=2 Tax=unclassified Streptomyces TaxID=2593676 RepID=UPI003870D26B|nr:2-oxo acid dehydrogenase subunit E2 [Streptomyces sp. NBC_01180]WSS53357.1 2-oxo acid dehydrogenase subunit E2 [Streptomyces sp. NBC_01180]